MAETFQFKLVTPTGVLFDGAVEQVTAVNPLGEFGVLPNHINFITSLVPGLLTMRLGDANFSEFLIVGGLAEVKDGVMTVLASEAMAPGAVDSAAAVAALPAAEERLAVLSIYDLSYADAAEEVLLVRARAHVNELRRAPN